MYKRQVEAQIYNTLQTFHNTGLQLPSLHNVNHLHLQELGVHVSINPPRPPLHLMDVCALLQAKGTPPCRLTRRNPECVIDVSNPANCPHFSRATVELQQERELGYACPAIMGSDCPSARSRAFLPSSQIQAMLRSPGKQSVDNSIDGQSG